MTRPYDYRAGAKVMSAVRRGHTNSAAIAKEAGISPRSARAILLKLRSSGWAEREYLGKVDGYAYKPSVHSLETLEDQFDVHHQRSNRMTTKPTEEQERAAFEAWCVKAGHDYCFDRTNSGQYQWADCAGAFDVWQARAALAPAAERTVDAERLDWQESHANCELSIDTDEDKVWWVVHRLTGYPNDREWHELGRGDTCRAAIDAARAAP